MSFLTGLSLKTWAIIAIVLVLAGFGIRYKYLEHEVVKAKTTIATQQVQIAVQKDTIKTDEVLKKVDEKAQVAIQKDTQVAIKKHEAIHDKLVIQEHEIAVQFDQQVITLANLTLEQQELSQVRIDSLWDAYCTAQPDATSCQGEPHA